MGPLPERDALKLLQNAGLEAEAAKRVNGFAHGHPLSLKLALAAIAERPDLRFREIASQHVLAELTRLYLAYVPNPQTRVVLEAASTPRAAKSSVLPHRTV